MLYTHALVNIPYTSNTEEYDIHTQHNIDASNNHQNRHRDDDVSGRNTDGEVTPE